MLSETASGQPIVVWLIAAVILAGLVLAVSVGFVMHNHRPWWH